MLLKAIAVVVVIFVVDVVLAVDVILVVNAVFLALLVVADPIIFSCSP